MRLTRTIIVLSLTLIQANAENTARDAFERISRAEQYELYRDALNALFFLQTQWHWKHGDSGMLVIRKEKTLVGPDTWTQSEEDGELTLHPEFDFSAVDKTPLIEEHFRFKRQVEIVDNETLEALIGTIGALKKGQTPNWTKFYREYPTAQGVLTLSAVGLNPTATRAKVSAWLQYNYLAGSGYTVYFKRTDVGWYIEKIIGDGVS